MGHSQTQTALSGHLIIILLLTHNIIDDHAFLRSRPPVRVQRRRGGGLRVVVSTAAFHAGVQGSVPGLGSLKETKNVSSPSTCESQYCGEPP